MSRVASPSLIDSSRHAALSSSPLVLYLSAQGIGASAQIATQSKPDSSIADTLLEAVASCLTQQALHTPCQCLAMAMLSSLRVQYFPCSEQTASLSLLGRAQLQITTPAGFLTA